MNKLHGIFIRSDARTVSDVHAPAWEDEHIQLILRSGSRELAFLDLRLDTIAVTAVPNIIMDRGVFPLDGFEFSGRRYYGNALVISGEGGASPRVTAEEIADGIRFFREDR